MPAVFCPRCGAHVEEDDKFCASCGATLSAAPTGGDGEAERPSVGDRVGGFVGTTPRARWLTAGTVIAIAIAVIAFITLDTSEDTSAVEDTYTLAADEICADNKKRIGREAQRVIGEDPAALPRSLVMLVAQWRAELNALDVPRASSADAAALDDALLGVEVQAATISRLAREGDRDRFAPAGAELDRRTGEVEAAISDLGLQRCKRIRIAPGAAPESGS